MKLSNKQLNEFLQNTAQTVSRTLKGKNNIVLKEVNNGFYNFYTVIVKTKDNQSVHKDFDTLADADAYFFELTKAA